MATRIAWNRKQLDELSIINLYNSGLSSYKIAKQFSVHYSTILDLLKRNNIVCRNFNEYRKYNIDENFFQYTDSHEKAYILGFIIADGCVSYRKWSNILKISLANKDYDHLVKIRNIIAPENPISVKTNKAGFNLNYTSCTLIVCSSKIVNDLSKYGVIPRKSLIMGWPNNIPDEFFGSCLLGVFDGDGSWSKYRDRVLFSLCSGNENFLSQLQELLINKLNLSKTKISTSNYTGTKYLRWTGLADCKKLYNFMYLNATIWMERKKVIARGLV